MDKCKDCGGLVEDDSPRREEGLCTVCSLVREIQSLGRECTEEVLASEGTPVSVNETA